MQKIGDFLLQGIESGLENLDERFLADEVMALNAGGDLEDPRCARGRAVARLGVERDAGEPFPLHRWPA